MERGSLATFSDRLAELDVTVERISSTELTDAIADEAGDPAVASTAVGKEAWLSDTHVSVDPTAGELWDAHTGVTRADFAIAEYGTIYLRSDAIGSEAISLFVEHHIAVLDAESIYPTMGDAIAELDDRARRGAESGILATGPSATADMGELVTGAHGPGTVHVIVVEEREET